MDNKKFKKDKELILDLENQIKEIRHQLSEQLRCLDSRMEHHVAMTTELIDFYQRRAEVEYEYARGLDRISKQIMSRHKTEKQKREQWSSYSMYAVWQSMVNVATKQGRDRTKIGDIFTNIVTTKLNQVKEDLCRVHKKSREVGQNLHEELMKAVADLHSFMKTYHLYNMESEQARLKLQRVESQRSKVEQKVKKPETSKQFLSISKKTEKHRKLCTESDLKATRSRNEYLLALNSANAALRKFYVDDMPDLINASNYGFHLSLCQVISVDLDSQKVLNRHDQGSIDLIEDGSKQINASMDLQSFLQIYQQAFSLPRKLNFQPHRSDTICDVQCPASLHEDMVSRVKMITDRLHQLKLENDELWKTLETTDGELVKKLSEKDFDATESFEQTDKPQLKRMPSEVEKQHSEIVGAQDFYLNKFQAMQLNSNMIARLSSKCAAIERAMKNQTNADRPVSMSVKTVRRRVHGNFGTSGQTPKLFGGSIDEYIAATQQPIPNIILFCTRFINRYGIRHQGIFRIPGLQHEINEFKNIFEKGEEPTKVDNKDINIIAGVLKLYFRELREPLFPLPLFDQLVACGEYDANDPEELKKCITRIQELLLPLPRPILIVIRYLFAFLNHLSEFSDENMMDPHNLAVCFGPTLLPVGRDKNATQQNAINEFVRMLIVYQEQIFPNDGGPIYERYISEDDNEFEESVDVLLESASSDFNEEGFPEGIEAAQNSDEIWDLNSLERNTTLTSKYDKRISNSSIKHTPSPTSPISYLNSTTSLPISSRGMPSAHVQSPEKILSQSTVLSNNSYHSHSISPDLKDHSLRIIEQKSPKIEFKKDDLFNVLLNDNSKSIEIKNGDEKVTSITVDDVNVKEIKDSLSHINNNIDPKSHLGNMKKIHQEYHIVSENFVPIKESDILENYKDSLIESDKLFTNIHNLNGTNNRMISVIDNNAESINDCINKPANKDYVIDIKEFSKKNDDKQDADMARQTLINNLDMILRNEDIIFSPQNLNDVKIHDKKVLLNVSDHEKINQSYIINEVKRSDNKDVEKHKSINNSCMDNNSTVESNDLNSSFGNNRISTLLSMENFEENPNEEVLVLRICEDSEIEKKNKELIESNYPEKSNMQMPSPILTTAEVFAEQARWDTIKKGSGSTEFILNRVESDYGKAKPILINEDELYPAKLLQNKKLLTGSPPNNLQSSRNSGGLYRDAFSGENSFNANLSPVSDGHRYEKVIDQSKSKFASNDSLLTTSPLSSCSMKKVSNLPATLIVYNRSDTSLNVDSGNTSPQSIQDSSPSNNHRASMSAKIPLYNNEFTHNSKGLMSNLSHSLSKFNTQSSTINNDLHVFEPSSLTLDENYSERKECVEYDNNKVNADNESFSNKKPILSKKPAPLK